jgi:hypothetical protein
MARLGPALLELESLGAYQTAPLPYGAEAVPASCPVQVVAPGEFVVGLFGRRGQPTAFMVVNRDYRRGAVAKLSVSLRGRRLEERDRVSGRWIPREKLPRREPLRLGVELPPGDGRLFRVAPAGEPK